MTRLGMSASERLVRRITPRHFPLIVPELFQIAFAWVFSHVSIRVRDTDSVQTTFSTFASASKPQSCQEDARLWFDFKAWSGANFSGLKLYCIWGHGEYGDPGVSSVLVAVTVFSILLWFARCHSFTSSSCPLCHCAEERHDGADTGHWC